MGKAAQQIEADTRAHRRAIKHAGNSEIRAVLEDAQAWAVNANTELNQLIAGTCAEYARNRSIWYADEKPDPAQIPRRDYAHNLLTQSTRVGGWFAVALEATLAAVLSIFWMRLPWPLAAGFGIVTTIFVAWAFKAAIAALTIGQTPERHKAARDILWKALAITAPIAVALIAVFFLTRGVRSLFLANSFGYDTAALGILLPIVAGILLNLSALFDWSGQYEDAYRRLYSARGSVCDLRDYCMRKLSLTADAQASDPQFSLPLRAVKIAPAILLALFLAAGLRPTGAAAAPVRAQIWIDATTSVNVEERGTALATVGRLLGELSRSNHIESWEVLAFGESAWRETPYATADLPRWTRPSCTSENDATSLFVSQGDSDCAERNRAALSNHQRAFSRALVPIARALVDQPVRASRCTSISDLLFRVSQDRDTKYAIIISDGLESCSSNGLSQVPLPPMSSRVVFVLTGSKAGVARNAPTPAEQFVARKRVLLAAAPWMLVVAPWNIDAGLFTPVSTQ